MLFEAWQYRQDQFETYQPINPLTDMNFEHVPWTGKLTLSLLEFINMSLLPIVFIHYPANR